MTISVTNR